LIECGLDFKVDLADLADNMQSHPEAKVLLLSHMRGYISDMDAILDLCRKHNVTLVEDAAHALGARWGGKLVGTFGKAACYSFQNYKIINAGEGGMIVTDDEELFVKMVFDQGAYEKLYERHLVSSPLFRENLNRRPLFNMRISAIQAAVARSQLPYVAERIRRYAEVYEWIYRGLAGDERIEFPPTDPREERVFDSIQFRLPGFTAQMMTAFIEYVRARGIPLEAFAVEDNARAPWNWKYVDGKGAFPKTHAALDTACDMRITTTMNGEDCEYLVQTVLDGVTRVTSTLAAVSNG
jgi:dTDP-4-amino-4,6-dideoxygalactose transaminase